MEQVSTLLFAERPAEFNVKVMRFACKITAMSRDGERFMEGREEVGRENRKVLESQVARARARARTSFPLILFSREQVRFEVRRAA